MAMRYAKASSVQKAKNRIKVLEDATGVAAHASTHASGASDPINSYYAVTAHGAAHGPTGTAALSSYYAATAHGSAHAPGGTAGLESYFAVTAHGAAHAATGSAALSSYYAPTAHGVEHGPSGTAALNSFYSTTAHTHAGGSGALTLNTAAALTAGNTTETVNITPTTNNVMIFLNLGSQTSSMEAAIQFNGDTGSTYDVTRVRGVTLTSAANATSITLDHGAAIESGEFNYSEIKIKNISAANKLIRINCVDQRADGEAAEHLTASVCWNNTAAQLTSITILRTAGTGTFSGNSWIRVYTYADS